MGKWSLSKVSQRFVMNLDLFSYLVASMRVLLSFNSITTRIYGRSAWRRASGLRWQPQAVPVHEVVIAWLPPRSDFSSLVVSMTTINRISTLTIYTASPWSPMNGSRSRWPAPALRRQCVPVAALPPPLMGRSLCGAAIRVRRWRRIWIVE